MFHRETLYALGLTVHMGHQGRSCSSPLPKGRQFTLVDVLGVFPVNISFCGCRKGAPGFSKRELLMRSGWWPASWHNPRTAFTYEVLNAYQLANFQAHTNLYDFWKTLLRVTNNARLGTMPVRHSCSSQMTRS
jgi:hypothetical protein